jgi:hypothetical protein
MSADAPDSALIGGGASADTVAATVSEELAELPAGPAGDSLTFTTAILDYLVTRDVSGAAPAINVPAVFVFSEYPARDAKRLGCTRRRGFRIDIQHDISGSLYITGSEVSDVYEVPAKSVDLDSLLQRVEDVQVPGKQIVLCPEGTVNERSYAPIGLKSAVVSKNAIDEFLTDFHQEYLQTPRDFALVWHTDPRHRVPVEHAEKAIERLLFPVARVMFLKTHIVRRQDESPSGRADISVTPRTDRTATGSCILELKVFRSKHYNANPAKALACAPSINEEALVDGLNQAKEYRRDLGTQFTFLCCFDFRTSETDTLLAKYEPEAARLDVVLRRYYLYSSAKEFRSGQPGAAKRSPS